jgi:2,3-bisphosphoglycerate-dependent phosphoglycerate mutase
VPAVPRLVLLRHGESEWNQQNLFTGWWDAALTPHGEAQASAAGPLMAEHEVRADVLHTSVQTRAIRTAELALFAQGRSWIPVRRDWRLNERHYGDLTGRNKAETAARYGADQVKVWRRSYDVPPPPLPPDDPAHPRHDPRYAGVPPRLLPGSESLKITLERVMPCWEDSIAPRLRRGENVLIAAHGNSLRALAKHLFKISDEAIPGLEVPTGNPILIELSDELKPVTARYLDEARAGPLPELTEG